MSLSRTDIENNNRGFRKFKYQQILSLKSNHLGSSFAYNKNSTILYYGCQMGKIKVYGLNNKIKLIQTLLHHDTVRGCLIFMKKSNFLVSGEASQIIIWNYYGNVSWKPLQILEAHNGEINCMVTNEIEELLISGGEDMTIKFWGKVKLYWNCIQIINLPFKVYGLSLNFSETKLITCGNQKKIKIFEHQAIQQQWIITQVIEVQDWGWQLCFIKNDKFVYQPRSKEFLEIYHFEEKRELFIQIQKVQIQGYNLYYTCFPPQFVREKNILIVKHGRNINFFDLNQDEIFQLSQSIEYNSTNIIGQLKDDGKHLVLMDQFQKNIQVFKLQFLD